ncbi:flagellar biosynthetic protein FliR [Desulfovibrio sp. OttesenSCG-928-F07]|nr:flagellar biosynthetic protein FliR [Desulfovibrio sp. OttesenSCG-928-F07]
MDIFAFDPSTFFGFVLTFIRVSLLIFLMPFFGGESIPMQVKALVCLIFTIAIWPAQGIPGEFFPAHPMNLVLLVAGELVLGMSLALMVNFIFAGIQLGGQIIGFQMGFSMLSLADPATNQQLVVTSFLANSVGMAVFLALDGHLFLLHGLMSSFELMPPGSLFIDSHAVFDMVKLSAQMFVLAVKVAGPVLASLFMVELALALMAKTAPQMNLLAMGFPIKIAVGFTFLSMMFSLIGLYMDEFIRGMGPMFTNFMRSVNGG